MERQDERADSGLCGLVTERDLALAEREFPGICELHARRGGRDRTFLDLLGAYLGMREGR